MRIHPALVAALSLSAGGEPRNPTAEPAPNAVERIASNDNRRPAGKLSGKGLTLRLDVRAGMLHPEADDGPGVPMLAFGEVGKPSSVPGPLVRVPAGTSIRVSIRNPFPDSTLTVHGLHDHPAPGDSGLVVPGGETREVVFTATRPGTWYYWATTTDSRIDAREWFESQLAGAIVVDPVAAPARDRVFVIGTWVRPGDSALPVPRPTQDVMLINGRSWPHTERFAYVEGDAVRWRWVNPSNDSHPMHLHGFYFNVDARGDWRRETVYSKAERPVVVTHLMLPGETMDISWVAERAGNWIFHCHFAFHVSEHLILPADSAPSPSGHSTHAGPAAPHRMAGLVLGMTVAPGRGPPRVVASAREPRRIRLLAQAAPRRFGTVGGMGYVVQDASTAPARDSIAIPGPTIVLRRGEPVAITVVNHLKEPTAVHWHGIELESFPDGVPGWSGMPGRIMPPILPNDSFVADFMPPRAGTFIYHTHSNEQLQMGAGLYGALLVVDSTQQFDPKTDRVVLVGGGGPADSMPDLSPGLVNGSAEPEPMVLDAGTTYRLRLININPDWRVIFSLMSDTAISTWRPLAKDGADLPPSLRTPRPAYLLTGPGETADFEFTPSTPGELRLEMKTQLPGWIIPVRVLVR